MPESFISAAKDWWPFFVFVAGGVVSFFLGRERQRWRVDTIGTELDAQSKRIARLEVRGEEEAVALAEIKTTQTLILTQLTELRAEMRGKADK